MTCSRAGGGWVLLGVLAAGAAVAQSEEPLPVSVAAQPAVVWVHRPVTLSGESIAAGPRAVVSLEILGPAAAGAPAPRPGVLAAELDPAGRYTAVFSDTHSPGLYHVRALAADGAGTADTTFRVTDAVSATAAVGSLLEVAPAVDRIDALLRTKIDSLPASPAKDELVRDLGELDRRLLTFRRDAPGAVDDLRLLLDVSARAPLPPKLEAERDALLAAFGKADEWITRTQAEEQSLRQQQLTCDNLEVVIEGFKFASFLLNFAAGGPLDIAQNFLGDLAGYAYGKGADAAGAADTGSFFASAAGKNAAGQLMALRSSGRFARLGAVTGSIAGTLSDLSGFAASKVMTTYCEQFTGPVKAHMKAQFFDEGNKWWEYSFELRGRITVHYPKDAVGSSVPLKGRIEGYAYGFKVWENAMTVLFPKLMSSAVTKKIVIPPVDLGEGGAAIGTEYLEGSVAGAAAPNAFFFQVTGTARKDRLLLDVGPARTDIDAKARVVALTLSPLSLAITLNSYVLPYKPAHFIFERTSGQYAVPLETTGKVIRGKQHFDNEVPRAENKGFYSVDIEVCNPGC